MAAIRIKKNSRKKIIGIFVDKNRNAATELHALYDHYYDFSKILILRKFFTKVFWREYRTGRVFKTHIATLLTGYFLEEANFSKDGINKLMTCFNQFSKQAPYQRTCVHSRQGDFITLGRETLSDTELTIQFPNNAYLLSDDLSTAFNLQLQKKHHLIPHRGRTEIDDWFFILKSKHIVCSPSTFSVTAALVGEELYQAQTQRKLLSEL